MVTYFYHIIFFTYLDKTLKDTWDLNSICLTISLSEDDLPLLLQIWWSLQVLFMRKFRRQCPTYKPSLNCLNNIGIVVGEAEGYSTHFFQPPLLRRFWSSQNCSPILKLAAICGLPEPILVAKYGPPKQIMVLHQGS